MTPGRNRVSLRDVSARARRARRVVAGISLAVPEVAGLCRQVRDSLDDIGAMATEIRCLRRDVEGTRMAWANLTAAGRAAIGADHAGEPDPLFYLLDELAAQSQDSGEPA